MCQARVEMELPAAQVTASFRCGEEQQRARQQSVQRSLEEIEGRQQQQQRVVFGTVVVLLPSSSSNSSSSCSSSFLPLTRRLHGFLAATIFHHRLYLDRQPFFADVILLLLFLLILVLCGGGRPACGADVPEAVPEFVSGDTRVYFELSIRSINDPAMKIPLCGHDERKWILKISVDDLFSDSREQRVKKLSEQLQSSKTK